MTRPEMILFIYFPPKLSLIPIVVQLGVSVTVFRYLLKRLPKMTNLLKPADFWLHISRVHVKVLSVKNFFFVLSCLQTTLNK